MTDFEIVARTVELGGDSSVSLDVSASNATGDSAAVSTLEITAENTGSSPYMVSSGPPLPFGILVASRRGDPSNHVTLWSESYSESKHLTTDDERIVSRQKLELATALDPGETVSAEYDIYDGIAGLDGTSDTVTAGTYLLQDADRAEFRVGGHGVELEISA